LINLYSFHSSIRIDQKKVLCELYLGVAAVEQRWWHRRRTTSMAAVAQEEAGVDGGSGDQWSREQQGLGEF
jgi:hypothetical protein